MTTAHFADLVGAPLPARADSPRSKRLGAESATCRRPTRSRRPRWFVQQPRYLMVRLSARCRRAASSRLSSWRTWTSGSRSGRAARSHPGRSLGSACLQLGDGVTTVGVGLSLERDRPKTWCMTVVVRQQGNGIVTQSPLTHAIGSEMDADVKGGLRFCWWWVMVGWLLGSGDRCDGNDDCHSEMRGSGPQDSVRSLSCLELESRVGIA